MRSALSDYLYCGDCHKKLWYHTNTINKLKLGQEQFVAAIRRFLEVQVLTRPLLQELIDHIDVYETEGVGKSRIQRVAVHYRFIGYIEIPELPKHRHNVKADTRQGVSVEYVPQIDTA